MLNEAMEALEVKPDAFYVDATLGGGGHSRAILERLSPRGRLLALDVDPGPLEWAGRWGGSDPRLRLARLNFRDLADHLDGAGLGPADGVLADLGLSSNQLLSPGRGFSFGSEGPLDMRLDPDGPLTAAGIVNEWPEESLKDVFWRLGEDRSAGRLARLIARERGNRPIATTTELAELARRVGGRPGPAPKIHPATRIFMALRLAVNGELDSLALFLERARRCLVPGGRLVVISFHSLEDRLVKRALRESSPEGPDAAADAPLTEADLRAPRPARPVWRLWRRKAVRPGPAEVAENPRCRSARLRAAEAI
jgi:16S rRNA (cytosine1402-N4)-methyltransferase